MNYKSYAVFVVVCRSERSCHGNNGKHDGKQRNGGESNKDRLKIEYINRKQTRAGENGLFKKDRDRIAENERTGGKNEKINESVGKNHYF